MANIYQKGDMIISAGIVHMGSVWVAHTSGGVVTGFNPDVPLEEPVKNKIQDFVMEAYKAPEDKFDTAENNQGQKSREISDNLHGSYNSLLVLVQPLITALLVPAAPMYRGEYHSKYHVEQMLLTALRYREDIIEACPCFENILSWSELFNAIIWHDAYHSLKEPFNELHAAYLYTFNSKDPETNKNYDVFMDHAGAQRSADAILATRYGFENFQNDVQRVLHDLDWYCFSDIHRLKHAENLIFEEFQKQKLGTEAQAVEARRQFYIDIIEKKLPVFVSAWMKHENDAAVKLIQERIDDLARGHYDSVDQDSVFP